MPRKPVGVEQVRASRLYTSKIIKAGALLSDTKTLLSHWDNSLSVPDNLDRFQRDNVLGKSSRSRVEDVLAIFRQRYINEPSVILALSTLVKGKFPSASLEPLFYFHSARSDQLLFDTVVDYLLPRLSQGIFDIQVQDIKQKINEFVLDGKTTSTWSDYTTTRVSQGLLSTLRDFGVLQGANNKKIAPSFLPIESFAYLVFYLKQNQPSGVKLLQLPDWTLFFMSRESVERSLFEAHQHGLLEYHVAGSVTRLTFPVESLEEYAIVLSQR